MNAAHLGLAWEILVHPGEPVPDVFGRAFVVPDLPAWANGDVAIQRDDGAVVYLNGVEIFRSNMTNGPVNHLTRATNSVGGAAETAWHTNTFNPSLLVTGTNLLAVEVHQERPDSSDLWFDLRLAAQPVLNAAPTLRILPGATGYEVRWPAWAAGVPIGWAADLAPSTGWQVIPPADLVVTNGEAVLPLDLHTPRRFFRLQWP